MIVITIKDYPELINEGRRLWQEAKELNLIFNSITNKIKKKNPKIG